MKWEQYVRNYYFSPIMTLDTKSKFFKASCL